MGSIEFNKYQAAENDFLVIEAAGVPGAPDPGALARQLCHRRRGVGADGLLVVDRGASGWRVAVYNADGSLAETSGNGLRCAVAWLLDRGLVDPTQEILLESGAGPVTARTEGSTIEVEMGRPRFDGAGLPAGDGPLQITVGGQALTGWAVSMGNPHLVVEIPSDQDLAGFPLTAAGMAAAGLFPTGVNLEVVQITGPAAVDARVHERGVGETRACGSGACAIAAALIRAGRVASPLSVTMPGGRLTVKLENPQTDSACLRGPADRVFEGRTT